MMDRPLTRRRWLALGGAAVATLAGCSSDPPQAQTPTGSVFERWSFEGSDLRIALREDHDVDRLNLIGPDGRRYTQTEVATGETTVLLQLLDIKPRGAGFDHYTPGTHDLIAISSGGEELERISIELRPELRIVDVHQYRGGEDAGGFGQLVVEVENVGTGPTWVYSIVYRNAPNPVANDVMGADPGILRLKAPTTQSDVIVTPGNSQDFVGLAPALELSSQESQSCVGNHELSLFVETPVFEPLRLDLRVEFSGDAIPSGLTGQYVCPSVEIVKI